MNKYFGKSRMLLIGLVGVTMLIGGCKCCFPTSPDKDCFPGARAWDLGPTDNPSVLPNGGELVLSQPAVGNTWRAFIRYPGDEDADFICDDTDGLSGNVFYCEDANSSLRVWEDSAKSCKQNCCIKYEFCIGTGCDGGGGERGSDGGGNTGRN